MADGSDRCACVPQRCLSSGTITEIWYALMADGRPCVAKFPATTWADHRGAARLIEREWEFLEHAAQPGVVKTFGLVAMDTGPGLLTEFLPGGDLVALAGSHPRHWAEAGRDVALTLMGIHARGFVHRDVKPRNVLFDADGHATLIDFALAMRAGQPNRAGGGTPAYQSSGQRLGRAADAADDVHGFATMVYELLCGELPFGLTPSLGALQTPPRSPLESAPALADEPKLVALAELTLAALSTEPADPARVLGAFQSTLHAMITA